MEFAFLIYLPYIEKAKWFAIHFLQINIPIIAYDAAYELNEIHATGNFCGEFKRCSASGEFT